MVPETFKPAVEAATHRYPHQTPLMPSGHLEGRFAPARQLAGGWFQQTNNSGRLHSDMTPRRIEDGSPNGKYGLGRSRVSSDSAWSSSSAGTSIGTPRRMESICDLDNALKYYDRQAHQRPAGGAYFETTDMAAVAARLGNERLQNRNGYAASRRSSDSGSSVSLHFNVPSRHSSTDRNRSITVGLAKAGQTGLQLGQADGERGRTPIRTLPDRPRPLQVPSSHRGTSTHGKSPLARKSFTRLATDYAGSRDAATASASGVSRRHSIAGEGWRGRRSVSVDRNGRRRLSKTRRPGRRSVSEG